ncbi:uncharacterized protein LOC143345685 [Colletes latitarsis]|uniref:uncharacterized protein LOC143345685 n=1 Tax=Colletes latitarsis TaxID=2605962 RepID=UPI00403670B3
MYLSRFQPPAKVKPRYFAKPEGTDPFQKLKATTTITLKVSLATALYDVYLITRCKTIRESLFCMARTMVPINFGAIYLTSAIYISTRLRQTDDLGNYIIGAIATGPLIHNTLKTPFVISFQLTMLLAFCAVTTKGLRSKERPEFKVFRKEPSSIVQHYD